MNVHQLRHIVDCIKNWGPLWGYSCFPFESVNGHLKRHFHETRNMNAQVTLSANITYGCLISHKLLFIAGLFLRDASTPATRSQQLSQEVNTILTLCALNIQLQCMNYLLLLSQ